MTPRTRTWLRRLGIAAAVLAGLYFVAIAVLSHVIRTRLQAMVAAHLNAELKLGSVRYHFPMGVGVDDASLVRQLPGGQIAELVKARHIDLALARFPSHHGPLVIQKLIFDHLSVRIVKTPRGLEAEHDLVKPHDDNGVLKTLPNGEPLRKISDMFRLRRFAINDGEVIFEDQTRDAPPMVWRNLHTDLRTDPSSGAVYAFHLEVRNPPLVEVQTAGEINVDTFFVRANEFSLKLKVAPDAPDSPLPGVLQQQLRDNRIAGELTISGHADVPLRKLDESRFDVLFELPRASAKLVRWSATLDSLATRVRLSSDAPPPTAAEAPAATLPASAPASPAADPVTAVAAASTTAPVAPTTQADRRAVGPPLFVRIEQFDAGSGDSSIHLERGQAVADPALGTWRVGALLGRVTIGRDHSSLPTQLEILFDRMHCQGTVDFTGTASGPIKPPPGTRFADALHYELIAYPRDAAFQPPKFPQPFEHVAGTVRLVPGLVTAADAQATYGPDHVFLTSARLPLADIARETRVEEIRGRVVFDGEAGSQGTQYPGVLEKTFKALRPGGEWLVAASVVARRGTGPGRVKYQVDISSDHATLAPTTREVPVREVRSDLTITNGLVTITRAEGDVLGGRVVGNGLVRPTKPMAYEARGSLARVDLKELAPFVAQPGKPPPRLTGRAFADFQLSGVGTTPERPWLDTFRAAGEFEVTDGDFWQLPVLKGVVDDIKLKQALTVGQAAGTFEIFDRRVLLTDGAVSSPLLGLQGSGAAQFDGTVEARVVAAPLSDWKDGLQRTGIPIVSDALGAVAGGIQKLLNGVTKELLYEFHVEGKLPKPKVTPVPAPILTQGGARLFGEMLTPNPKPHGLLDAVKRQSLEQKQTNPAGRMPASKPTK